MGAIGLQRSVSTSGAVSDSLRSSIPGIAIAEIDGVPVLANAATIPGLLGIAVGAYLAARMQRPRWPLPMQWMLAIAWFGLFEIADTLHTLGHIRSARQADAPMDGVVLTTGLQMTVYEKTDVPPRQHVGRALGGPLASGTLTLAAFPLYSLFRHVPILSALTEAWLLSNAIILAGALSPTPHFDGASILKWVVTGRTGEEALGDEAVQEAGSLTVGVLIVAAMILVLRGKWRWAGGALFAAALGALDLYVLKGRLPT
jgi:Zn-dependent protease